MPVEELKQSELGKLNRFAPLMHDQKHHLPETVPTHSDNCTKAYMRGFVQENEHAAPDEAGLRDISQNKCDSFLNDNVKPLVVRLGQSKAVKVNVFNNKTYFDLREVQKGRDGLAYTTKGLTLDKNEFALLLRAMPLLLDKFNECETLVSMMGPHFR
ncbi:MAG: PC4/YdbC family ssDNA-binding protein [Candidatus Roizmanbacteria bacterium]